MQLLIVRLDEQTFSAKSAKGAADRQIHGYRQTLVKRFDCNEQSCALVNKQKVGRLEAKKALRLLACRVLQHDTKTLDESTDHLSCLELTLSLAPRAVAHAGGHSLIE